MKKLAIAIAVSAAALLGGPAANATDGAVKVKAATDVTRSTDFSSRGRHWRHYHVHRHWRHSYYRPYYGSYGYYPQPYYYGGGPVVSFGFGGGGWGHHRHW